MLGEQTENKRLKEAIERTQSSVEKGENLSDSMRENEEFPSILIDMTFVLLFRFIVLPSVSSH